MKGRRISARTGRPQQVTTKKKASCKKDKGKYLLDEKATRRREQKYKLKLLECVSFSGLLFLVKNALPTGRTVGTARSMFVAPRDKVLTLANVCCCPDFPGAAPTRGIPSPFSLKPTFSWGFKEVPWIRLAHPSYSSLPQDGRKPIFSNKRWRNITGLLEGLQTVLHNWF